MQAHILSVTRTGTHMESETQTRKHSNTHTLTCTHAHIHAYMQTHTNTHKNRDSSSNTYIVPLVNTPLYTGGKWGHEEDCSYCLHQAHVNAHTRESINTSKLWGVSCALSVHVLTFACPSMSVNSFVHVTFSFMYVRVCVFLDSSF